MSAPKMLGDALDHILRGTTPPEIEAQRAAGSEIDHAKAFATLQARAALAGVSLVRSTDDQERVVYIASKWAMTRQLDTIEAVEQFLQRLGSRTP